MNSWRNELDYSALFNLKNAWSSELHVNIYAIFSCVTILSRVGQQNNIRATGMYRIFSVFINISVDNFSNIVAMLSTAMCLTFNRSKMDLHYLHVSNILSSAYFGTSVYSRKLLFSQGPAVLLKSFHCPTKFRHLTSDSNVIFFRNYEQKKP